MITYYSFRNKLKVLCLLIKEVYFVAMNTKKYTFVLVLYLIYLNSKKIMFYLVTIVSKSFNKLIVSKLTEHK